MELPRSPGRGEPGRPVGGETTADFAQGLAELPQGSAVFVAGRAGRVVGYAYAPSPDTNVPAGPLKLGSLYVMEDVAGTGVAQALMEATVDHARAAGHGLLTAWVRQENGRARRFYEKYGKHLGARGGSSGASCASGRSTGSALVYTPSSPGTALASRARRRHVKCRAPEIRRRLSGGQGSSVLIPATRGRDEIVQDQ